MPDPNTRPPATGTIDVLDALRLLRARADDDAQPILQAAIKEIQALRRRIQAYQTGEHHRAYS